MSAAAAAPNPWWQHAPQPLASFFDHVQRQLTGNHNLSSKASAAAPSVSISAATPSRSPTFTPAHPPALQPSSASLITAQLPSATTKADLGRATWVLLHTLAAQFPDEPSRQQKADAKTFVTSLAKVYPCGECAEHFQQVVRSDPPDVSSRAALQQWMCRLHNSVNRRIGKPTFNCTYVASRWAPLDCGDNEHTCDMQLGARRRR